MTNFRILEIKERRGERGVWVVKVERLLDGVKFLVYVERATEEAIGQAIIEEMKLWQMIVEQKSAREKAKMLKGRVLSI